MSAVLPAAHSARKSQVVTAASIMSKDAPITATVLMAFMFCRHGIKLISISRGMRTNNDRKFIGTVF